MGQSHRNELVKWPRCTHTHTHRHTRIQSHAQLERQSQSPSLQYILAVYRRIIISRLLTPSISLSLSFYASEGAAGGALPLPLAEEVRETLACPAMPMPIPMPMPIRCGAVGVVGCNSGESRLPLPLAFATLVARVRNQQSMGVGLPFIMTGPRYSR